MVTEGPTPSNAAAALDRLVAEYFTYCNRISQRRKRGLVCQADTLVAQFSTLFTMTRRTLKNFTPDERRPTPGRVDIQRADQVQSFAAILHIRFRRQSAIEPNDNWQARRR